MHRCAPIVKRDESTYFTTMALDNLTMLEQSNIARETLTKVREALSTSCARLRDHLDARARGGFVRRCHGDLHLRNIVVLNGRPVPFDALEFDEELATGDVYYDLAFLLMDLEHRGLRSLASHLLSRYAAATDDFEGLKALPLFLATRAAVRAKVAILSTSDARDPPADLQSYIDLAGRCLRPIQPRLIAIGGLSGTGKSSVAQQLAAEIPPLPGAVVLRSDVVRKQLRGVPDTTRLTPDAYTTAATIDVYQALNTKAARILAAGHSAIIDAVFATPEERTAVERLSRERGVAFLGLWLEAPLSVRQERISQRLLDPSDANEAVAKKQETYEIGALAWRKISAAGPLDDTVQSCIFALCAPPT
jgi:predicted kinase